MRIDDNNADDLDVAGKSLPETSVNVYGRYWLGAK